MTLNPDQFEILHLDPMGQGVAKRDDKIYFVPKTLPGENVSVKIIKKSKGVHFAELIKVNTPSQERTVPTCKHFDKCQGCHYLHTSYKNEADFKTVALSKILQKIATPQNIDFVPSPKREGQRNRIQLHYDLNQKKLGFISTNANHTILEVPFCQLPVDELQTKLKEWYHQDNWIKDVPASAPRTGHVELYLKENKMQITWNSPYSDGGFTQVNTYINKKMHQWIKTITDPMPIESILDLFGGNGNLSAHIKDGKIPVQAVVDVYPAAANLKRVNTQFLSLNLYQDESLPIFKKSMKIKNFDVVLIDPPRSGFNLIGNWTETYKPKHILYISCNPHTLARDLALIPEYSAQSVTIFDMFPGTHHFEVGVHLTKK